MTSAAYSTLRSLGCFSKQPGLTPSMCSASAIRAVITVLEKKKRKPVKTIQDLKNYIIYNNLP